MVTPVEPGVSAMPGPACRYSASQVATVTPLSVPVDAIVVSVGSSMSMTSAVL